MKIFKHAVIDALMSAYVQGWYDGSMGKTTDNGKHEAARETFRNLMANLGMHEEMHQEHQWGEWHASLEKPGMEYRGCHKCHELEYKERFAQ